MSDEAEYTHRCELSELYKARRGFTVLHKHRKPQVFVYVCVYVIEMVMVSVV